METKEYLFGDTAVIYLINDDNNVSMLLIPSDKKDQLANPWEKPNGKFDPRAQYISAWRMGSLAYFFLSENQFEAPGLTMKCARLASRMKFKYQKKTDTKTASCIETALESIEGYTIIHRLTYIYGRKGFECETEYINNTDHDNTLEMLTSFTLDNLSPFHNDDAPNAYCLHRFHGGWSLEGKHVCESIESLSLEKSWSGNAGQNERFGVRGSYPVDRYFPTAVVEDKDFHVCFAAQLCCNSTWQMELSRYCDTLSFSGGLGDNDFCGWKKVIKKGEHFTAPKAFIAAVSGTYEDACMAVTDMQKTAWEQYGEKGLPVCFNEYCTTWGKPTQDKMLSYLDTLKDFDIKYLVIDAGWCKKGCEQDSNGEWLPDKEIFPDIKSMNQQIRHEGKIPGIWFEFEVTTKGSVMYGPAWDYMHLTRNGRVIKNGDFRSYWDFRRPDVIEYLRQRVICFLKDNDFGYLKVDYNANIGMEVDGDDSQAEALREHLCAVRDFFMQIKKEIPDIIIENCSSGGHRLEPSMLGVSAVSSFSDAHEAIEIPYIAANLHYLMLPAQELIWAVIHNDEPIERTIYLLASTFLGRICLSGQIDELRPEQLNVLKEAICFYKKLDNVLINGATRICGNRSISTRYPTGTQIVIRKTDSEILAVCHAYDDPADEIAIELDGKYIVKDSFYASRVKIDNDRLIIKKMDARTACAVLLEKE